MNSKASLHPIKLQDTVMETITNTSASSFLSGNTIYIVLFILIIIAIIGVLWILFIKPMLNNNIIKDLKINNKVAIGGMIGTVRHIDDQTVSIDVGTNNLITFVKTDIASIRNIATESK